MHHVRTSDPIVVSLLRKGKEVCFTITSESMRPAFFPGDKIGIQQKHDPYRFGDVVLFKNGDGFCVHRIIANRDGRFLTKGDGKKSQDPPVKADSILGHVVWRERAGTSGLIRWVPGWRGRISLLGAFGRCLNIIRGILSRVDLIAWAILRDIVPGRRGVKEGVE